MQRIIPLLLFFAAACLSMPIPAAAEPEALMYSSVSEAFSVALQREARSDSPYKTIVDCDAQARGRACDHTINTKLKGGLDPFMRLRVNVDDVGRVTGISCFLYQKTDVAVDFCANLFVMAAYPHVFLKGSKEDVLGDSVIMGVKIRGALLADDGIKNDAGLGLKIVAKSGQKLTEIQFMPYAPGK